MQIINKLAGGLTMSTLRLMVLSVGTTLLTLSSVAMAQEPTGPAMAPPAMAMIPRGPSDLELRAIGDRPVALRMTDGNELPCQVLAMDPEMLVVRITGTAQVVSVPRASIVQVLLRDSVRPPTAASHDDRDVPQLPTRKRYVGLSLSILPGVSFDVDYGLFHGFANVGVVLPLASEGEIVPFSLGAGVALPISRRLPSLKLDMFGYLAAMMDTKAPRYYSGSGSIASSTVTDLGFGVGIGIHYTWNSGLTMGGSVPIFGYSARLGDSSGQQSIGTSTAFFYLASATALPLFFIGYRF